MNATAAVKELNGRSKVVDIADHRRMAYVGASPSKTSQRDSDSWYTPSKYVEAARVAMGGIDLDPFSSSLANLSIKATRFLDVDHSAFDVQWRLDGEPAPRVWMNPPYSGRVVGKAIDLFVEKWKGGDVSQAVILANNATDTQWFSKLRQQCTAVCFTDHRISFQSPDGKRVSGNTRGQVFFYFGTAEGASSFRDNFKDFGWCVSKTRGWL